MASISWTVTVEVVIPSAVMELGAALMVELEASASPTVKATVAESPMVEEFKFPVTVASPEVVAEVRWRCSCRHRCR